MYFICKFFHRTVPLETKILNLVSVTIVVKRDAVDDVVVVNEVVEVDILILY